MNDRAGQHEAPEIDGPLARLSRGFRWISQIAAPDAPGFCFFGAEVHAADFGHPLDGLPAASLSGKGTERKSAFEACVGEGIEHLSRLEWGDEDLTTGRSDEIRHGHDDRMFGLLQHLLGANPDTDPRRLDWMRASRLPDRKAVLVPADLCLRRIGAEPPSAISTGCAAGPTREAATLAALLELVERDAAALWWKGGRAARPVSLETLARADVTGFLAQLRGDAESRTSWLLDITTDLDIPCFAAISFDAQGKGFASGLAARADPAEAIRAALLELCQIELGHHIVAAKLQVRGEDALNAADRRKLRRSRHLDARRSAWLYPTGRPRRYPTTAAPGPAETIDRIVANLRAIAAVPMTVDLTRAAFGVPVVRALAPGLQPFPSRITTARLAAEMHKNRIQEDNGRIPLF